MADEMQNTANAQTAANSGEASNAQQHQGGEGDIPKWLPERLERAKNSAVKALAAELGFGSVDELKASFAQKAEPAKQPQPEKAKTPAIDELAEIRDTVQSLKLMLEAEKKARAEAERGAMISQVAQKFGLPQAIAMRLQGNTMAELEKDAADLAAALPKPQTFRTTTGLVAGQQAPTLAQEIKARMSNTPPAANPFFDPDMHRAKGGGVVGE